MFITPDHKPYKEVNVGKTAIVILCILILLSACFGILSCNPVKRAYKGVAKYSPQTTEDTTNFYKRAKDLIKEKPPITKKGATIRVPYPVEKLILDTVKLRQKTDSLKKAYNYKSTDCDRMVNESYTVGYQQARYELSQQRQDVSLPDTVFYHSPEDAVSIANLQLQNNDQHDRIIKSEAQQNIYKGQSKSKTWSIIILAILLGASFFFNIKNLFKSVSRGN